MLFSKASSGGGGKNVAETKEWYGWKGAPDSPNVTITSLTSTKPPTMQKIVLAPGETAVGILPTAKVSNKDKAYVDVSLTSTSTAAAQLRVVLVRNGSGDEKKSFFKTFAKVGQQTEVVTVGGQFSSSYQSLRVELKNVGTAPAEIVAQRPEFRVV